MKMLATATPILLTVATLAVAAVGCRSEQPSRQNMAEPVKVAVQPVGGGTAHARPRAVVYRTNGDYNANVPVTLGANGLTSFPGPGDVSESSMPVRLKDGWLLDRRGGIGQNTAFLKYTYKEYHALKAVPSPKELMAAIIPGARVTEAYALPIYFSEANAENASQYIDNGFEGCAPLIFKLEVQPPQ